MLDLPKDKNKEFVEKVISIARNAGCKVCIFVCVAQIVLQLRLRKDTLCAIDYLPSLINFRI